MGRRQGARSGGQREAPGGASAIGGPESGRGRGGALEEPEAPRAARPVSAASGAISMSRPPSNRQPRNTLGTGRTIQVAGWLNKRVVDGLVKDSYLELARGATRDLGFRVTLANVRSLGSHLGLKFEIAEQRREAAQRREEFVRAEQQAFAAAKEQRSRNGTQLQNPGSIADSVRRNLDAEFARRFASLEARCTEIERANAALRSAIEKAGETSRSGLDGCLDSLIEQEAKVADLDVATRRLSTWADGVDTAQKSSGPIHWPPLSNIQVAAP